MLFGWYIIGYLFLAGVGSGAFLIASFCCVLDAVRSTDETARLVEAVQTGFYAAPCFMALSGLFLLFDLGNVDYLWAVALMPFQSVMSVGAWLVALLTVVSGALALSMLMLRQVPKLFAWACCLVGGVCSFGVMTYTGILLASMIAIDFWHTPWLTVLFIVSSLSTGSAVVLGLDAVLMSVSHAQVPAIWRLSSVLGGIETCVLAIFLFTQFGYTQTSALSCVRLLKGDLAPAFWLCVVGAGLVLPALCHRVRSFSSRWVAVSVSSAGVLLGGLALRYCIVAAALFTPYALGAPL